MNRPAARDQIRSSYAAIAHRYDRRWRGYLRDSIEASLSSLGPRVGERVLDVGCGTGALLRRIADRHPPAVAWGVDLSEEMLAVANRACPRATAFLVADAAWLAFPDGYFDAVVSTSSLHHWEEPLAVFAEIGRVLRPNGRLVVTDWCRDVLVFRPLAALLQRFDRTVYRIYSADELTRLLGRAGFVVESATVFRAAGYWGMMAIRARAA